MAQVRRLAYGFYGRGQVVSGWGTASALQWKFLACGGDEGTSGMPETAIDHRWIFWGDGFTQNAEPLGFKMI